MAPTVIQYYIMFVAYFADEAEYNFAVSVIGGSTGQITPADIASTFGFVAGVNYNTGGALNSERGMYGFSTVGIPAFPGPGTALPGFTGGTIKSDVLTVQLQQTAGAFPDGRFTWTVSIQKIANGTGPIDDPTNAPVPVRRWITGFEMQATAEGGQAGGSNQRSRDSSRTLDGVGYGLRNSNNINMERRLDEYSVPAIDYESWERIYFRIRTLGTANNIEFWQTTGFPSSAAGAVLRLTTAGLVQVINRTAFAVETVLSTVDAGLADGEWHKLDIIVRYNNLGAGGSGRIRLYSNGINLADHSISVAQGGLGANSQRHVSSILGCQNAATAWEWDFDDWHNAEVPNIATVESLTSLDWLVGTHVEIVKIDSGTQVNWTGPLQSLNSMPTTPALTQAGSRLVSTTSGAQVVGITEANDVFEGRPTGLYLSQAAALVCSWSNIASGAVGGRLGYSLAGGPGVFTTTVEVVGGRFNDWLYPGNGTEVLPASIVPFSTIYEKAANGVSTNLHGLGAEIQYIGVWGFEDNPDYDPTLPRTGITHNAYWPLISQAFLGPSATGPVAIQSSTYVGNGTQQTILAPLPFHFLWIRNVTNPTADGVKWWAANLSGHLGCEGKAASEAVVRVDYDPVTGIPSFTVAGTSLDFNAVGNTYQYIMFCDPGMIYNMSGAFIHSTALASASNPLLNSTFLPQAGFFIFDRLDADTTIRLIYKGPGDTVNAGNDVNGVDVANCATFGTGNLTSLAGIHNPQFQQTAYSLWRTGSACDSVMVQIFSYTGDGTGARVITCTPSAGRFPCFVYVQPTNAVGFVKDPSDIGTSSRQITGGSASATAITAVGSDSITVGSTLNANGIIYNVFVLPGDALSFTNGTFTTGVCLSWIDFPVPPIPIPGANILGNGGLVLNGSVPLTLLLDVSGIYTIVPGKTNDTLYDRQAGQPNIDVAIPNPRFKTGYIGG